MEESILSGTQSMMGGAKSGGENLGTKPDKGSQDTPAGGKLNYLKQASVGRSGGEEFKYPLRFSDELQTGPTRETLETTSNISAKAGEGI